MTLSSMEQFKKSIQHRCNHPSTCNSRALWSKFPSWMHLNNSQSPKTPRDQLGGTAGEKAILSANIKVNVSFLKVFVFFPGSPCLLHLATLHVIMAALCTLTGFQQRPCKNTFNTWVFPQVTLSFHCLPKWAHFQWLTSNNKFTVLGIRRDTQSLFSTSNPCINRWYE